MAEYLVLAVTGPNEYKGVGVYEGTNTVEAVEAAIAADGGDITGTGRYAAVSNRSWKEHGVKQVTSLAIEEVSPSAGSPKPSPDESLLTAGPFI
jgi:metal-dependent HD superfamily phosphatase/phosphodiesterase